MVFSGSARRAEGRRPEARRVYRVDLLIMRLFEMLITNMMFICGTNNMKINIT